MKKKKGFACLIKGLFIKTHVGQTQHDQPQLNHMQIRQKPRKTTEQHLHLHA